MSDTFVVDDKGAAADLPAEKPAEKVDDAALEEAKPDGTDEAEEQEEDTEEEGETPKKPRNKVSARKRIGQLTAEVRGLQRQLGQLTQPKPVQPAGMPKQEDFETYEEYIDARAMHVARQTVAEQVRMQTEAQRQAQREQLAESFRQRSEEAAEKYDDYDEVIEASEVPITNAIGHAIMESEIGPDISYYLATHPAEARKIVSLSPVGQIREIGKLEVKLTDRPKKTTAAPAPPKTLRAAAMPVQDPDKMPIKDWMEQERKRLQAKGKL